MRLNLARSSLPEARKPALVCDLDKTFTTQTNIGVELAYEWGDEPLVALVVQIAAAYHVELGSFLRQVAVHLLLVPLEHFDRRSVN